MKEFLSILCFVIIMYSIVKNIVLVNITNYDSELLNNKLTNGIMDSRSKIIDPIADDSNYSGSSRVKF